MHAVRWVVLAGQALCRPDRSWEAGELYRPLDATRLEPLSMRLVPYYAWGNRGPSTMSVWLGVALRG